jgi:cytochrome c oxidase subunit 2
MNDLLRRMLFLPEQASSVAAGLDRLHYFVIITTMIASTACGLGALFLYVRFRRRPGNDRTPNVQPPPWFEPGTISVTLGLFLVWWALGYRDFIEMTTPPPNTFDVYVTGKQWMWKFSYPGGPNSIESLHVPAHRPVRLLMTSRDVIHSFYVPAFRLKQDVLPGRFTQMWFDAVKPGSYEIFCAEMCGIGHSAMLGTVVVHEPADFDNWLAGQRRGLFASRQDVGETPAVPAVASLPEQGARVAAEAGCLKCHSTDGSAHIGPTFLDLYLRREKMQSGEIVTADDAYLTESIMDPLARIVAGFPPVMPTYQGRLSPPEIAALLEYVRSLHTVGPARVESRGPVFAPAPELERGPLDLGVTPPPDSSPAALAASLDPADGGADGGGLMGASERGAVKSIVPGGAVRP